MKVIKYLYVKSIMENVRHPPFHIQDDTLLANTIDYLIVTFSLESCFRYNERYN